MDHKCDNMLAECALLFGELKQRIVDLERRCETKERRIDELRSWQNKTIGYSVAVATMISGGLAWLMK